jgi:hypothetical protein
LAASVAARSVSLKVCSVPSASPDRQLFAPRSRSVIVPSVEDVVPILDLNGARVHANQRPAGTLKTCTKCCPIRISVRSTPRSSRPETVNRLAGQVQTSIGSESHLSSNGSRRCHPTWASRLRRTKALRHNRAYAPPEDAQRVTAHRMVLVVALHNLPKPYADVTHAMVLPMLCLDDIQLRNHPLLRCNAPDV